MAFRAVVVLPLMSSMSLKFLPFNISFIFGNRKRHCWADRGNMEGFPAQLFVYSVTDTALIPAATFSGRHTKTHSDNKRRHSERDCPINNTDVKRWYASVIKPYWSFCPLLPRQAHRVKFANFIVGICILRYYISICLDRLRKSIAILSLYRPDENGSRDFSNKKQ
jgi:hypothetical protein